MIARLLLQTLLFSACYGFAIGSVHSHLYALRNLLKFPLLILLTATLCALAYYITARLIARQLRFGEVQRLTLGTFHDTTMLLASLGLPVLFLAHALERPVGRDLNEYPLFLGLNVLLIALCGTVALCRQARLLLLRHQIPLKRGIMVLVSWLLISLFAGGQCAWFLRPFFGVSSIEARHTPFFMGTMPDCRGAGSFYEAVYHLFAPPPPERIRLRLNNPSQ